ncbi:MAG: hypothetical protein RDU14_17190 [Melioribacteraceae bacterium]|jgi:hypothetical protein|nr:hypothetical protein [Melioribacteraceae bacterium]
MKNVAITSMLLLFFLCSCNIENSVSPEIPEFDYHPTVGNTIEKFGYVNTVKKLSYEDSYNIIVESNQVTIGLIIEGYESGSVRVEVITKNGSTIFNRTALSNTVQGQTIQLGSPLDKVKIKFVSFTGMITLGVTTTN